MRSVGKLVIFSAINAQNSFGKSVIHEVKFGNIEIRLRSFVRGMAFCAFQAYALNPWMGHRISFKSFRTLISFFGLTNYSDIVYFRSNVKTFSTLFLKKYFDFSGCYIQGGLDVPYQAFFSVICIGGSSNLATPDFLHLNIC